MTKFEIFIFGCINFSILIVIIVWSMRKTVRRFLYARRANLKKQMVSAGRERRNARARLLKDRADIRNLEADLSERRKVMEIACRNECAHIYDDARRRASGIIHSAKRQVKEEAAQASARTRREILERAFRKAEGILREEMSEEERRRIVELGLSELRGIVEERVAELRAEGVL
ncbi:MAG TPA: hypothetical protein PLZ86_01210 [bacterium]|nr:hypothetical protein [bacterium]